MDGIDGEGHGYSAVVVAGSLLVSDQQRPEVVTCSNVWCRRLSVGPNSLPFQREDVGDALTIVMFVLFASDDSYIWVTCYGPN